MNSGQLQAWGVVSRVGRTLSLILAQQRSSPWVDFPLMSTVRDKPRPTCSPEQHAFDDLPDIGCWLGWWVLGLGLRLWVPSDAAIAGHLWGTENKMRQGNGPGPQDSLGHRCAPWHRQAEHTAGLSYIQRRNQQKHLGKMPVPLVRRKNVPETAHGCRGHQGPVLPSALQSVWSKTHLQTGTSQSGQDWGAGAQWRGHRLPAMTQQVGGCRYSRRHTG